MTMSGTCATHVLTKAKPKAVWSSRLRCMQVSRCWWSVNCCVQACKQTQRETHKERNARNCSCWGYKQHQEGERGTLQQKGRGETASKKGGETAHPKTGNQEREVKTAQPERVKGRGPSPLLTNKGGETAKQPGRRSPTGEVGKERGREFPQPTIREGGNQKGRGDRPNKERCEGRDLPTNKREGATNQQGRETTQQRKSLQQEGSTKKGWGGRDQ